MFKEAACHACLRYRAEVVQHSVQMGCIVCNCHGEKMTANKKKLTVMAHTAVLYHSFRVPARAYFGASTRWCFFSLLLFLAHLAVGLASIRLEGSDELSGETSS